MCGRYALFSEPGLVADAFGLADGGYEPTYNAARAGVGAGEVGTGSPR